MELILWLIVLFRRFLDRRGRLSRILSQQDFAVYGVHIPIVVFLVIATHAVGLEGLLKFGLLSFMAVPVSFAVAYPIRRIPLVGRVI